MIGNPKFHQEQQVNFAWEKAEDEIQWIDGVIYIVDAEGTVEQQEEPSYDILALVEGEKTLFKHVRESLVRVREA